MNRFYLAQTLLLMLFGPYYFIKAQDPVNQPNTTVYIYKDLNNNGDKEPDEPYLSGFTLDATSFEGESIPFTEDPDGVFKGYVPRRALIVVNGYSNNLMEGNASSQSAASVFYAEPKGGQVSYKVAISPGPQIDYNKQNIILPCYEGGPAEGRKGPALIEFGFMHNGIIEKLGGKAPNPNALASIEEIGATWGVGIRQKANIVYTSALLKRHVGLGPMGIGGLYQYDINTGILSSYNLQGVNTTNSSALDFGSIQRENTDGDIAHDGSDDYKLTTKDKVATYDLDAFAKVGKAGIGDIDVTEDENTLWLVNLYSRSLVSIDISGGQPDLSSIKSYPILNQTGLPDLSFPFVRNFNIGGQTPGGAEAFTDPDSVAWERDKYSAGGQPGHTELSISGTMNSTNGTTEATLYKCYRAGTGFSYNIPVPAAGTYTIKLHFAETDTVNGSNRKFTVKAEGLNKLVDFNILNKSGTTFTAIVEEFDVDVNDDTLNLDFTGLMGTKAIVSGIQVIGGQNSKVVTGELRPWGLGFHDGRGYLGLVADASYTKAKDHLIGYVVSFDPGNINAGFQVELEIPMKYPRERSSYADVKQSRPLRTSVWEAWVDTWDETNIDFLSDTMNLAYPQPIISDVDFDSDGNMIIGVMGRWAHQIGFLNYPPISGNQTYLIGYASGDILKAEPNVLRDSHNFILEPDNNDTIPFFENNDGPSYDGEFFYNDYFESPRASHGELFTGGLGVMPIINEVVLTVFNPIVTPDSLNFDYNGVYTQGTHVYSTTDGTKKRASLIVDQYQYGKANGLGDLEFSLLLPDNCVGNYVWCDGNGDGIQQANENGIPNIKLYLILIDNDNGNQLVDSTTTDERGLYSFCELKPNKNYIIKIDLSQPNLDGFQRKASPAFQGNDPRLNSDGLDNLIPGCVIAEVKNLDYQFNYGYDFGLLGPESRDVTRTLCLEPDSSNARFDMCEIESAVRVPGDVVTQVQFYKTETDAQNGVDPLGFQNQCEYATAGDTIVAKVFIPGDEQCYSLSKVTLVVNNSNTNIELNHFVCPGDEIDLEQLVDLNQDGLMVFTNENMDQDSMIQNINNYVPDQLPVTLYFKATFENECEVFGTITLNTVPPFEMHMKDEASICVGDIFYFSNMDVSFPKGSGSINEIKWSTSGTGKFNSGREFSKAQSYTPSEQDISNGFVTFTLSANNECYSEKHTAFVDIRTDDQIRFNCLASDTVYCIDPRIEDPFHPDFKEKPTAVLGCDQILTGELVYVEMEMEDCDTLSNVASRIIRHWEFNYKDKYNAFCTDTIFVFRLPKLTPDAFIGNAEDTFYCELKAIPHEGELLKRYVSWKQPLGLHDYELPYTKLRGLTYELPLTIIEAGLLNARAQGTEVYNQYLNCVILRKADGTEVTIGDIVSGDYMANLIANATSTQKGYGFLQALIELDEEPVKIIVGTLILNYYPYLLLQPGDWVLSEGGNFEHVDESWFYNGNNNAPYWFAGGWPSNYGDGECETYCDVDAVNEHECIYIQLPSLKSDDTSECDTFCISEGDHCGISIVRNEKSDWSGMCPKTRGIDTWITQTCWSSLPNTCGSGLPADEIDLVVSYDSTAKGIKIHLSQWQTLIDTVGPIFEFCYPIAWDPEQIKSDIGAGVYGKDVFNWERSNPTTYRVNSNECIAEIFAPDIKVVDNCSGVHSVKAMINLAGGTRAIALEVTSTEKKLLPNGDTCYIYTFSHTTAPIRIPPNSFDGSDCSGGVIEVRYEAADNCWNQSTWTKYIRIIDDVPPTLITDREVTVSLDSKVAWVHAETFDEGSYDNCGIDFMLVRRMDWLADTACINLCEGSGPNAPYNNWVDLLDDLGVDRSQAVAAVNGQVVGESEFSNKYNINDLATVLNDGEIEKYYFHQLVWLWEDYSGNGRKSGLCGSKIVYGWLFSIAEYIAENCSIPDEHGNTLKAKDLEKIFDYLTGKPGYGKEIAYLGGGWAKSVPFKCQDACEQVMVELAAFDYCCNWGKGWTTVDIEDAIPAQKLVTLEDITISCDAYSKYYKPVLDLASKAVSSENDPVIFDHLNNLLGGYEAVWKNKKGEPVDIEGNVLPSDFSIINTVCEDSFKEIRYQSTNHDNQIVWKTRSVSVAYLVDKSETYKRGYVSVNCDASISEDIWPDLDECGVGSIMRKFYVTTGCGDKTITKIFVQNITIEPTCPLKKEMFSWPEDTEICTPFSLNTNGKVDLPISEVGKAEYTFPQGCRMIAIGYDDKVFDVPGQPQMKKVFRTYTAMDWCTGESVEHTQAIVVVDTCEGQGGNTMTLAGTIVDVNDNFIKNVSLNMETDDSRKVYSIGDGKYFMDITSHPDMIYLDKESSYSIGISTLDLIWLQRYFRDHSVFENSYQILAADVNNNGIVEPGDLFEIRNLILGKINSFVRVRPWMFVDKTTQKTYSKLDTTVSHYENNWIGVKMGDVNFDSDYLIRTTNRSRDEIFPVTVVKSTDAQGNDFLTFRLDDDINLSGFQLSLDLSSINGWKPGKPGLDMTSNNWAIDGNNFNVSWNCKDEYQYCKKGKELFTIKLDNLTRDIRPEDIRLNPGFESEVYTMDLKRKTVGLNYESNQRGIDLRIFPNPSDQYQIFEIYSPENSFAKVTIQSIDGKVLEDFDLQIQKGKAFYHHQLAQRYKSGIYVYQLKTRTTIMTGRFEIIR